MNKIYLCLVALAVLWSCNSAEDQVVPDATEKLYSVEFDLSNFESEVTPMSKIGQKTDSKFIKRYYFNVYQNGVLKAYANKANTNDSLVKVRFELPKGDYVGTIVAFNDSESTVSGATTSSLVNSNCHTYKRNTVSYINEENSYVQTAYDYNYLYNDYFYKNVAFRVDSSAKINAITPRVSGRIELHFKDIEKLPNATDYPFARVKFEGINYGINFKDGTPNKTTTANNYVYLTQKQWNQFISRPVVINAMASATPKITIEYIDNIPYWGTLENAVIKSQCEIEGFKVYSNKITRLRGNAFLNTDFEIEIDTEWDGEVIGGW